MKTYPSRLSMIQEFRPGSFGAEIGVYRGDFSHAILTETKVGQLYLVDPWVKQENYNDTINLEDQEGHYQETLRKVRPFILEGKCTVIRDFSKNAADLHTSLPLFDWVFVDAYHAYEAALEDITLWSKRLKPAPFGVIFAHDYFEGPKYGHQGHAWYSGVVKACTDFCAKEGWEVTGITTEDLPTAKLERKP
jgi:hypothetical protein